MDAAGGMWGRFNRVEPFEVMVNPLGRIAWIWGVLRGEEFWEGAILEELSKNRPEVCIMR